MSVDLHDPLVTAKPGEVPRGHTRPFSIDLSLELERELDAESLPSSPPQQLTFDPDVLSHLVVQLRQSLADSGRELAMVKDQLASALVREAHSQDALQFMSDKATALEEELAEAKKKQQDDEEAISLLRTKVEESRRGLMRLQTESRRQSMALDTSRANYGSPNGKRMSMFTPLTGSGARDSVVGHKRMSSSSTLPDFLASAGPVSPSAQVISFNDNVHGTNSRRVSSIYGRGSSPVAEEVMSAELESLRNQVRSLKEELESVRHDLSETKEARDASETCVKALREFIAENEVGGRSDGGFIKLPPLPTMAAADEDPQANKKGWGFKLWKGDVKPPGEPSSPATATLSLNGSEATRKPWGFFTRSSISSFSATSEAAASPLQTNAALPARPSQLYAQADSTYSASDVSSLVEPVSPKVEGLAFAHVTVRTSSETSSTSPADEHKAIFADAPATVVPHHPVAPTTA